MLEFRNPGPQDMRHLSLHRGESVALAEFPNVTFTVDELLG
jgi:hypothetical protein